METSVRDPLHAPHMTNFPGPAEDLPRGENALRIYADDPLEDGDAVLLIDDTICLEIERLADEWDDRGRRSLADILTKTARRVLVAIARDGSELLPGDYQLWRELHQELRDTEVELLPVRALPAA